MAEHESLRVFVVDDQKVIASTLATILNTNGYSATFFTNPVTALAMAAIDPPDYLVSDVMMPELSGIDLAILLVQECPNCRVLLFSGQADSEDLLFDARGQSWNFDLLCKPVHPTEILRRIGERPKQKFIDTARYRVAASPSTILRRSIGAPSHQISA